MTNQSLYDAAALASICGGLWLFLVVLGLTWEAIQNEIRRQEEAEKNEGEQ